MKTALLQFLGITFFCLITNQILAQAPENVVQGGNFDPNPQNMPCLTESERENIKAQISESIEHLKSQNVLAYKKNNKSPQNVLFDWPVKKAAHVSYDDIWSISGYVDHNPVFGELSDYLCGGRTYDVPGYNHMGIDIYTWPFSWYAMDYDQAEIVAAADGQIILKSDGNFDRNCSFNSGSWNAVYIQHEDGSIAWYGHMKNGSLTPKAVGSTVSKGEYLGVVGSSGNSTGPHLHFEVYDQSSQLIDPYEGPCNTMNTDSWWESQKPYNNPNINAMLTHFAPPQFPSCPQQEIPNLSSEFDPGEIVYFAVYLRDQAADTDIHLKVIRPNGTALFDWTHDLTNDYYSSYWYWSSPLLTDIGEWKWEATYLGQTVTHLFTVGVLNAEENQINTTVVYPNPVKEELYIQSNSKIVKVDVVDRLGKIVSRVDQPNGIENIDFSRLSSGLYFVRLKNDENYLKVVKIIKE